jgi:chorismate mutase
MENGQKSLDQWRTEIDLLDGELLRLLNRRAAIACEIAVLKLASGISAYDPHREQQVLAKVAGRNQGPLDEQSVVAIFASIIHETRRLGTQRMQELSGLAPDRTVQDAREV